MLILELERHMEIMKNIKFNRIFVIVMDSVGIGAADDASKYNDSNTNTFKNLSYSKKDFFIPTLDKLGIGCITDINNTSKNNIASFGKMKELSVGKDTLTGHWEMMGLEVKTPFPSFTDTGFPKQLIDELEKNNIAVSGVFASDGFVRERFFRNMKVLYYIVFDLSSIF